MTPGERHGLNRCRGAVGAFHDEASTNAVGIGRGQCSLQGCGNENIDIQGQQFRVADPVGAIVGGD
jgi:hypothetical protein